MFSVFYENYSQTKNISIVPNIYSKITFINLIKVKNQLFANINFFITSRYIIPAGWKGFEISRKLRGTTCKIEVKNNGVMKGISKRNRHKHHSNAACRFG